MFVYSFSVTIQTSPTDVVLFVTSLFPTVSCGRELEREGLISSHWYLARQDLGTVQSFIKGDSDFKFRKHLFTKRMVTYWTRIPGEVVKVPSLSGL